MAFDFTSAASFKPKVENTFLGKGGGGGNTGYFRRKKKKEDEDNSILSNLLKEGQADSFSDKTIPSFEIENETGILDKLKGFMGKIL